MSIRSKAVLLATAACLVTAGIIVMHHASAADDPKYPVTFTGGHDYDKKRDHGRPVVLIAAALEVPPDVFREAFSGVKPAKGGGPSEEEARKNKTALMNVLKPHGVTNERLDEVSNFYRFRPQNKELWHVAAAKAHAIVENGKITQIVVDEPGYGYSSPPTATVAGFDNAALKVTIRFAKDLKKNGAIDTIELVPTK
jgi:hypothetical protein